MSLTVLSSLFKCADIFSMGQEGIIIRVQRLLYQEKILLKNCKFGSSEIIMYGYHFDSNLFIDLMGNYSLPPNCLFYQWIVELETKHMQFVFIM